MCLAIPIKVIEINGNEAVAESMGMKRKIRIDFVPEVKLNEYVIVHAGFAIERLPEEQALEDIKAWQEVEDAIR